MKSEPTVGYYAESPSNTMWPAVICGCLRYGLRWSAVFRPTGGNTVLFAAVTVRAVGGMCLEPSVYIDLQQQHTTIICVSITATTSFDSRRPFACSNHASSTAKLTRAPGRPSPTSELYTAAACGDSVRPTALYTSFQFCESPIESANSLLTPPNSIYESCARRNFDDLPATSCTLFHDMPDNRTRMPRGGIKFRARPVFIYTNNHFR